MNNTLLESQDEVLQFTSLALSAISTLMSAVLQSVQNTQTLQHFLSPLYTELQCKALTQAVRFRHF